MTELRLPSTMSSLGNNVFGGCTAIATINSKNTTPPTVAGNSFDSGIYGTAKLFVPEGAKSAYAAADVWKEFSNIAESSFSGAAAIEADEANAIVTVYSITGQKVAEGTGMPELNAGVYIVKKGNKTRKIVVR